MDDNTLKHNMPQQTTTMGGGIIRPKHHNAWIIQFDLPDPAPRENIKTGVSCPGPSC